MRLAKRRRGRSKFEQRPCAGRPEDPRQVPQPGPAAAQFTAGPDPGRRFSLCGPIDQSRPNRADQDPGQELLEPAGLTSLPLAPPVSQGRRKDREGVDPDQSSSEVLLPGRGSMVAPGRGLRPAVAPALVSGHDRAAEVHLGVSEGR